MQDDNSHLLHLGDLAVTLPIDLLDAVASTYPHPSLLAEEDGISLNQLSPGEVQEWCLLRITEYQNHNRVLRQSCGPAARDAISKNKSHIRALRSAYNDASPIHQYLPTEMLTEVFSHVHPAMMSRRHIPVLRVCRYWQQLIFRTPQFWANLLTLPTWKTWNSKHHMGRFRAALVRSAPENLDLSVPYYNQIIVDALTPHANRLSSLQVGPTIYSVEEMTQILEQHMPHLTHLAILHYWWYTKIPTFDLKFRRYPNVRSLELERTHSYTPVSPYSSLRHLKLKYCSICPSPTAGNGSTLCAVHNALEFFPNLETLSMTRSLSDANDLDGRHVRALSELPELNKTVHLPRLRHLEVEDIPDFIPRFLSHLVIPTTTSLVLEPAHIVNFSQRPTPAPLFPGINPLPPPHAELSLCLYFRATRQRKELARWETSTRGDGSEGVRPVRVTLPIAVFHIAVVCSFTREIAEALAPAPARGVTSLTVEGAPLSGGYWAQLLRELPGLRRFACQRVWSMHGLAGVVELGKRLLPGDGFPCARLEDLVLGWELWNSGQGEGEMRSLQLERDGGECEYPEPKSEVPLVAELSEFCDVLGACLAERAGHCEPIRRLAVSLRWKFRRNSTVWEGWKGQRALVEQRLHRTLGDLVGDVAVSSEVG